MYFVFWFPLIHLHWHITGHNFDFLFLFVCIFFFFNSKKSLWKRTGNILNNKKSLYNCSFFSCVYLPAVCQDLSVLWVILSSVQQPVAHLGTASIDFELSLAFWGMERKYLVQFRKELCKLSHISTYFHIRWLWLFFLYVSFHLLSKLLQFFKTTVQIYLVYSQQTMERSLYIWYGVTLFLFSYPLEILVNCWTFKELW